jgi:hypothetical protein
MMGKRLFNEPFTGSGTIMEYPTLGDVDGDGVADVVLAGRGRYLRHQSCGALGEFPAYVEPAQLPRQQHQR